MWLLPLSATVLVWLLDRYLIQGFPDVDSGLDYGYLGVMLPVLIYMGKDKLQQLAMTALGLILLGLTGLPWQWWALEALPVLALYNGQRGKANIGKFFYWYYPVHLVAIYGISLLL